ncbi:hypothetical protein EDD15DRAFT_763511 [Pisolithus albus]|nr:hypothetical protein EDD15DRAFT_763511 [Pisolithus albus]
MRSRPSRLLTIGCVLLFLLVAHAILYVPGCPAPRALADKAAPPLHSASGTLVTSRIAEPLAKKAGIIKERVL